MSDIVLLVFSNSRTICEDSLILAPAQLIIHNLKKHSYKHFFISFLQLVDLRWQLLQKKTHNCSTRLESLQVTASSTNQK